MKPTTKTLKRCSNRQNSIELWAKNIKKAFKKDVTGGLKIKKENVISGLSRGDFWQPLIAPEARRERSCQSFSAWHIGPRADCPFHRPAFFRPAVSDCVRMALHFFVNFGIFKWLYLAYFWVYLHPTWGFCKAWSALLWLCGSIVAYPIIYRFVPSPSRFENRQ